MGEDFGSSNEQDNLKTIVRFNATRLNVIDAIF